MGEFDLISRYFTRPATKAALGVGDDCALLAPAAGMQLAVSSDMLVEGRHFLSTVDRKCRPSTSMSQDTASCMPAAGASRAQSSPTPSGERRAGRVK